MIAPAVALVVFALLFLEALVLVIDQVRRARDEAAYWDARARRPEQYDWAKELDL